MALGGGRGSRCEVKPREKMVRRGTEQGVADDPWTGLGFTGLRIGKCGCGCRISALEVTCCGG